MRYSFVHRGDWSKTQQFLNKIIGKEYLNILAKYGQKGVAALSAATPVDTGKTATSWTYEIEQKGDQTIIRWNNSNINKGVNIAIILQYGHGTGTGGYVQGRDYINPALRPIFDEMADSVWKEVTS